MDVFTFPLKNPKYCTIKELQKTCTYLNSKINVKYLEKFSSYQYNNKQEYIDVLYPCYTKYGNVLLPYRIQINFQNEYYYINRPKNSFRSLIKTYDDELREVYKLTTDNGRLSYTVRYCKIDKIWENETNFKVQEDRTLPLVIKEEELNKLRNISLYFEVKHIFTHLYLTYLLKDVIYYLIKYYINFLSLPPLIYNLL